MRLAETDRGNRLVQRKKLKSRVRHGGEGRRAAGRSACSDKSRIQTNGHMAWLHGSNRNTRDHKRNRETLDKNTEGNPLQTTALLEPQELFCPFFSLL